MIRLGRTVARRTRYVSSLVFHRARRFASPGLPEGLAFPPSLALLGKSLVDELALASVAAWASLPPSREIRERAGEVRDAIELFAARGWLDAPAGYHAAPPPLDGTASVRRTSLFGASLEHLRFESEFEPPPGVPGRDRWLGHTANRTAHAWVLRHPGDAPWIVCLHPFQTGTAFLTTNTFRARWLHESLGLNVLMPVLPLHGPRKATANGEGLLGVRPLDTLHGMSQALWDVRRLLSWIRSQSTRAIGVYGLSLGGYATALLAAFEPELAFVIAGVPAVDFVALERWHAPPYARRRFERAGTDWEAARRVLSLVSPLALPPRIPRDKRFLFAGLGDRLTPARLVHDLWKRWDEPRILWFRGGHISCRWEPEVERLLLDVFHAAGWGTPEVRLGHSVG